MTYESTFREHLRKEAKKAALWRIGIRLWTALSARISFKAIVGHVRLLICFRHLVYYFLAYLSHKATFVPTLETIEK